MPDKKPKHARPKKRMPPQMSVPPGTVNAMLREGPLSTAPMLPPAPPQKQKGGRK